MHVIEIRPNTATVELDRDELALLALALNATSAEVAPAHAGAHYALAGGLEALAVAAGLADLPHARAILSWEELSGRYRRADDAPAAD